MAVFIRLNRAQVAQRKRSIGCRNPKQCGCSSDPFDNLTFGWGKLDDHGYWQHLCAACARDHEKRVPEHRGHCWPFPHQEDT